MHHQLTVYQDKVFNFIEPGFKSRCLADDCLFTEGPVWDEKGYYLFSDITANHVYSISANETKKVVISNSGTNNMFDPDLKADQSGSNGLAWSKDGDLLICRHGSHSIGTWQGGEVQPYISVFRGKLFNSPNDLVVHENGSVFFSDPPYGLKNGQLNPGKFQSRAGVYAYAENEVKLFCDRYQYPNGVCLSPNQETLYISSNKPSEKFISMYDAYTLDYKGVFAEENSDGMKMDEKGNMYLSNKEGILILDQNGERLALISLPAVPANCCWGGKEGKDLLVTAREYVYLLEGLKK
ncbi:MAG: SMP-30/gluconolactonase/LRE family protein [Flavisolibacter sp.]